MQRRTFVMSGLAPLALAACGGGGDDNPEASADADASKALASVTGEEVSASDLGVVQQAFTLLAPVDGTESSGRALNNATQVVGISGAGEAADFGTTLWYRGSATRFPTIGGIGSGSASAINDAGKIVGSSTVAIIPNGSSSPACSTRPRATLAGTSVQRPASTTTAGSRAKPSTASRAGARGSCCRCGPAGGRGIDAGRDPGGIQSLARARQNAVSKSCVAPVRSLTSQNCWPSGLSRDTSPVWRPARTRRPSALAGKPGCRARSSKGTASRASPASRRRCTMGESNGLAASAADR